VHAVFHRSRRQFLIEVGRGMVAASIGWSASARLCAATPLLQEPGALSFGPLEPLVALLLDTPVDALQRALLEKLRTGTPLKDLVAAAALANARTFGGEDYVGFHTMMALAPAWRMANALPPEQQALPVFKVLCRNTNRLREYGGRAKEVLHAVSPATLAADKAPDAVLRDAVRSGDLAAAEGAFAAIARGGPQRALDAMLHEVQDMVEVHRAVLPHRAWDLLAVIGLEHAHTLLRQSVHYCAMNERFAKGKRAEVRTLLPKLFAQYKLDERTPGTRTVDDAWVARTSELIFRESPDAAAEAAAAALAEGVSPDAVGEAIALAANQILLRDPGRTEKESTPTMRAGSVHGASPGVHACDSANAWRGMARASNAHNTFASLVLGAFQASVDRAESNRDLLASAPWPQPEHTAKLATTDPDELLRATEAAIRANDQAAACAAVARYGEVPHAPKPVFDLMLRYAVSEDGNLHAEKYWTTASEEFAAGRAAFRWRHLCSLARVTASEFGTPAPGQQEARELLRA
jgi:hypothetical protein